MRTNCCRSLTLTVVATVACAQGLAWGQSPVIKVKTAPTYVPQQVPPAPPESPFGPVTNGDNVAELDRMAPRHKVAPTPPNPDALPPLPNRPSIPNPVTRPPLVPAPSNPPPSPAPASRVPFGSTPSGQPISILPSESPNTTLGLPQPLVSPTLPSPIPDAGLSATNAAPVPTPAAPVATPAAPAALAVPYSEYIDNSASGSYLQSPSSPTYRDAVTAAPPITHQRRGWFNRDTGFLRVNTPLSFHMLDFQNRQTDKEVRVLEDGVQAVRGPSITIGAQLRASGLYGRTDTADQFSYFGRSPEDFVGNTATDIRLLQTNQSVVIHANSWAHGYVETLFTDGASFHQFDDDGFQVRQAYILLGDLNQSPFYAFLGKKNVSFGDFGTLSPFSQALPWHYFGAIAEGGGLGYTGNGLRAQVMALSGGQGTRVVDSEEDGHINNFAANIRYDWEVSPDLAFGIGGGYLHGTIYDAAISDPIDPTAFGPRNGAWDVNGSVHVGALRMAGEFVQTEDGWPSTGRRVSAWRAEAAYDFLYGNTPCVLSGSFGEGNQGASGTEFEFNRQLVVGLRIQPSPNAFFTFEYVRSTGFAPLVDVTTASDRSAEQNSAVFGLVLAI